MPNTVTASEAMARLKNGNERFASRNSSLLLGDAQNPSDGEQKPIAIVLGCSDARAPVEIVFDQPLGDLFVIRVAGNVVAPSQIASIEFAASTFGTQLVVVLGHSDCGAVAATLNVLQKPTGESLGNLDSIVNRIRPAIEPLMDQYPAGSRELKVAAVAENIRASTKAIKAGSGILNDLMAAGKLLIVGAEYELGSGKVTFFSD